MTDYAYKKVKLSERQRHFCYEIDHRHDGASNHIGVDYGGWTAHNQIVSALKKKGVLVSENGACYTLVVGEPLVVSDPKFGKPYIKVKKEVINLFTGEKFENVDTQIYLDPRGDVLFHIILPYNISTLIEVNGRGREHVIDEERVFVAHGKSLEEVLNNTKNMTLEYDLASHGDLLDVLAIVFESKEADTSDLHGTTMLGFNYTKMIQAGDSGKLFLIDRNGYMKEFDKKWAKKRIIIRWTQEREDALEALRSRIIKASNDLRAILFSEELVNMLDNNGQLMLEHK